MRVLPLILSLGAVALTAQAAGARCAPPKPRHIVHHAVCPCTIRHPVAHVRRYVERDQVQRVVVVHDQAEHFGMAERRAWAEQHAWGQERYSNLFMAWQDRRPWATDQFGYLTWPGKTHFIGGQPVDGGAMPPPPPGAMPPGPPPGAEDQGPPPGADWQGPPPGADMQGPPPPPPGEDGPGYAVQRF